MKNVLNRLKSVENDLQDYANNCKHNKSEAYYFTASDFLLKAMQYIRMAKRAEKEAGK
jgi:hypothetical protein